jgi:hypothetical protein
MRLALPTIACVALTVCLVSCTRDLDGVTGTGGAGGKGGAGGMGGPGIGMSGNGGGASAGMGGAGGACLRPDELCPATYAPVTAGESCDGGTGACRDEQPCGPGRRVYGLPNFENTLSCVYDSQGALVSATTCGYRAYNSLCRQQSTCAAPGSGSCVGGGSLDECFTVGENVACAPADGGPD